MGGARSVSVEDILFLLRKDKVNHVYVLETQFSML